MMVPIRLHVGLLLGIVICDGLRAPVRPVHGVVFAPLTSSRARHLQLVAKKKASGGKSQNRRATKHRPAPTSKVKSKKAQKRTRSKQEIDAQLKLSQINHLLAQASSFMALLASAENATIAMDQAAVLDCIVPTWAEPEIAQLPGQLTTVGARIAESESEITYLKDTLDEKTVEVVKLSELLSSMRARAGQAESEIRELRAALAEAREIAEEEATNGAHAAERAVKASEARWAAEAEMASARSVADDLAAKIEAAQQLRDQTHHTPTENEVPRTVPLEDFMLTPSNPIHSSIQDACRHLASSVGLQWEQKPKAHELAVRNVTTEIYVVFKLLLAPPSHPWDSAYTRRLVVTHAGVPPPFRRRGILSRTMDELAESLQPDEIEIDRILSDVMREYARTRGYELVSGHNPIGGSFRRRRDDFDVFASPC